MDVKDRIKTRRTELGLTLEQVGDYVGVSKSTVKKWESGFIANMRRDKIARLAEVLKISPVELMGWETSKKTMNAPPPGFDPLPEMVEVPLVGRIACGQPITAEENLEGYVSIPAEWHATFTLICQGDSMEPTIHDGDLVAVRKDVEVENGQIAAVRIEDEATLKRVYLHEDYIELRPENPSYGSIIKRKEEMNDVTIEGRAVGLCRGI